MKTIETKSNQLTGYKDQKDQDQPKKKKSHQNHQKKKTRHFKIEIRPKENATEQTPPNNQNH